MGPKHGRHGRMQFTFPRDIRHSSRNIASLVLLSSSTGCKKVAHNCHWPIVPYRRKPTQQTQTKSSSPPPPPSSLFPQQFDHTRRGRRHTSLLYVIAESRMTHSRRGTEAALGKCYEGLSPDTEITVLMGAPSFLMLENTHVRKERQLSAHQEKKGGKE